MSAMSVQQQPEVQQGPPPAPVASEGRIGLRNNLRHIGALVRRNSLQIKANPEVMVDAVLMPIVFTLLFTYVFGGAMVGSQDGYVNYLLPGLMAMGGITLAVSVGAGINEDFKKGVMDRFRTMPIARSSVLIAKVVVEVGRMMVSTCILITVGFLVGFELRTSVLQLAAAVGLALLFGASLTWIFILLGLSMANPQAVAGAGMLVIMPLQFGSSIFADPSTMPSWLESFTNVNPLSNLADASRALMNGGTEVTQPVIMTLIWSGVFTAVAMPLAVRKFRLKT